MDYCLINYYFMRISFYIHCTGEIWSVPLKSIGNRIIFQFSLRFSPAGRSCAFSRTFICRYRSNGLPSFLFLLPPWGLFRLERCFVASARWGRWTVYHFFLKINFLSQRFFKYEVRRLSSMRISSSFKSLYLKQALFFHMITLHGFSKLPGEMKYIQAHIRVYV